MAHLTLGEIRGGAVLLQMAHAAMPKGVHTTRHDPDAFAKRLQHVPDNVVRLKRRTIPGFKDSASGPNPR
jgi:hypothetical protein